MNPPAILAREIKRELVHALKSKMKAQNLSVSALAKKLKTGRFTVQRVLDPDNISISLNTISRVAHALGLKITLRPRELSPKELKTLADKMVNAPTKEKSDEYLKQIVEGFYGETYPDSQTLTP